MSHCAVVFIDPTTQRYGSLEVAQHGSRLAVRHPFTGPRQMDFVKERCTKPECSPCLAVKPIVQEVGYIVCYIVCYIQKYVTVIRETLGGFTYQHMHLTLETKWCDWLLSFRVLDSNARRLPDMSRILHCLFIRHIVTAICPSGFLSAMPMHGPRFASHLLN